MLVPDRAQPARDQVERLVPTGLAKAGKDFFVIDQPSRLAPAIVLAAHILGDRALRIGVLTADQGYGKTLGVLGVIPSVAPFHAQAFLIARAVAPLGKDDGVLLLVDVIGERAAHTAVGANAVHALELRGRPQRRRDGFVDQRAGRTYGDALAAGDAGALAHWIVEIEGDARAVTLAAAADHLIVLDVVAGADAAIAQDARLVVDGDHR